MAGKYSGPYIPGGGGDDSPPPSPRKPSLTEKYGAGSTWQQERAENQERLAIWMKGRAPIEHWEHCSGPPPQSFYCLEFPGTDHYFVVAWERFNHVPLGLEGEMGVVYAWCFGCDCSDCGACTWARKAYAHAVRRRLREGRAFEGTLPF